MPPAQTEIVIRLRADIARAFRTGTRATGIDELNAALSRFGVDLKPQHPRTTEAELQSYFTISNVPSERAEEITAALRMLDVVEGAYVQPPASPP